MPAKNDPVQLLFEATKKHALSVEDACNKLECSPKRLQALIKEAGKRGLAVNVEHGHVGVRVGSTREDVRGVVAPTVSGRHKIGVISDTHLGSKYCLRPQLRDFIHQAYADGVRVIVHPGDVLDGDYRHAKFEMSHMGIEAQTQDLYETLPQLDGLKYYAIAGNHDFTFTDACGIDTTKFIQNYFRERGRADFVGLGDRSAHLRVGGVLVHLWHPRSGVGYAISYPLQRKISGYASATKPSILLAGHWHQFGYTVDRGVHAIACPTFQGGGSAFGKSLGGAAPAIGGQILSWALTAQGTMRRFALERFAYYERETEQSVQREDRDGDAVDG